MEWKDDKLQSATISNTAPVKFSVLYGAKKVEVSIKPGQTIRLNDDLAAVN